MKLYQFDLAPSSNRVALFLKETGINVPTVQLNIRDGDQFKEPYNSLNPFNCVPFLDLGNGTVISESWLFADFWRKVITDPLNYLELLLKNEQL